EVIRLGVELLGYLSVSGIFITIALAHTGGLQGTGDTRSPFVISVISQMIIPLGICAWIQSTGELKSTDIWMAILTGHMTRAVLSVARFRQQKWRNIKVEVARSR